jgi:hypothetical protein
VTVFVGSTATPLGFGRSWVNELKSPGKPFEISKWAVMEAWEKVKANKGEKSTRFLALFGFRRNTVGG